MTDPWHNDLTALRGHRDRALGMLRDIPDTALEKPSNFMRQTVPVRYILQRLSEHDGEHTDQLHDMREQLGVASTAARRILARSWLARGHLLAALLPITDAQLDLAPADDRWSIRHILGHVIAAEETYRIRSRWCADHAATPGRPLQPEDLPTRTLSDDDAGAGSLAELKDRLLVGRARSVRELADLTPDQLAKPTFWMALAVDVRFRLQRFAAHDLEHAQHVQETLDLLGIHPTGAQRLLALAEISRGGLLGALVGWPHELIEAEPTPGQWSVRQVLEHCGQADDEFLARRAARDAMLPN